MEEARQLKQEPQAVGGEERSGPLVLHPTEERRAQASFRGRRGTKMNRKISVFLSLSVASALIFLISFCAFRLTARAGARLTRKLADEQELPHNSSAGELCTHEKGDDDEVPPQGEAGKAEETAEKNGAASADSEDEHILVFGDEGEEGDVLQETDQASSRPSDIAVPDEPVPDYYPFPLITNEEGRAALQGLLRTFHWWSWPHWGLGEASCSFRYGPFDVSVKMTEFRKTLFWPIQRTIYRLGFKIEKFLLATIAELEKQGPGAGPEVQKLTAKKGPLNADSIARVDVTIKVSWSEDSEASRRPSEDFSDEVPMSSAREAASGARRRGKRF